MGLFDFLKSSKNNTPAAIGNLRVDIHSHLIPGIDDGAPTMDHSIGMIRKFQELGYHKLIMTPHVMSGVYDNSSETIRTAFDELKATIQSLGINMELEVSAEYFLDETLFERIISKDFIPFNGNHVLFELSFRHEPQQLEDFVFLLCSSGYQPVIAHFERYPYYHDSIEMAKRLKELGCMIQVNLNSFTGHYGPGVKKQAQRLLKANLIDIAGSDCHRIEHLQILESHLTDAAYHELLQSNVKNTHF
jgi:tyrosine-protein phosphatase YwqE